MRYFLLSILLLSGVLLLGCGEDSKLGSQEEASFKKALDSGKGEFDINNVPPEHRDRVRAIMESQKSPAAGAPTPR